MCFLQKMNIPCVVALCVFAFLFEMTRAAYYNVPCSENEDCPSTFECVNGFCNVPQSCTGDPDCPVNFICSVPNCVLDSCTQNWECDNGYWCNSGTCTRIVIPIEPFCLGAGTSLNATCGLLYQDSQENYRTKIKVWGQIAPGNNTGFDLSFMGANTVTWDFGPNSTICEICAGRGTICASVFENIDDVNNTFPVVKCWGNNQFLGTNDGDTSYRPFSQDIPNVLLPTGKYFVNTCARTRFFTSN